MKKRSVRTKIKRTKGTNGVDLPGKLENDSLVGSSSTFGSGILVLSESSDLRVGGSEGGAWIEKTRREKRLASSRPGRRHQSLIVDRLTENGLSSDSC